MANTTKMQRLLNRLNITSDEFINTHIIIDYHKNKEHIELDNTKLHKPLFLDKSTLSTFYDFTSTRSFIEDVIVKQFHNFICLHKILNVWIIQNKSTLECFTIGTDCIYNLFPDSNCIEFLCVSFHAKLEICSDEL